MKKIFALLLAAMLLVSICAFAEEAATEEALPYATEAPENAEVVTEAIENQDVLDYEIVMDKVPDGITLTYDEVGGVKYAVFTPEDETETTYVVSVGYTTLFDADYTMTEDLTEDQLAQAYEILSEDYADPVIEMKKTGYGTAVILVNENAEMQGDYAELFTVWHGYMITMFMQNDARNLTDDDIATGMQILEDMWIK